MTAVSTFTIPPSQNTAPVFQFHCLYTHDLRKKQKRYHDGVLRFHTFNKRIMVYDQMGNYSGDLHWQQGQGVGEGDEFTLDNGVLVTVGEALTTLETDLAPLLDRKTKQRPAEASRNHCMGTGQSVAVKTSSYRANTQSRHRALSAILKKPEGAEGILAKGAMAAKSQLRIQEEKENNVEIARPTKRQKTTHTVNPPAVGNTSRANAIKPAEIWSRSADTRQKVASLSKPAAAASARRSRFTTSEVVDLVSDIEDHPSSGVTLPETSPTRISRPPAMLQRFPVGHNGRDMRAPSTKLAKQNKIVRDSPPSSPPVSAVNTISDVEKFLGQSVTKSSSSKENKNAPRHVPKAQTKPLRIPIRKAKKVLLCENQSKEYPQYHKSEDSEILTRTRACEEMNAKEPEMINPCVKKKQLPENPRVAIIQEEACSPKPTTLASLDQRMLKGKSSSMSTKRQPPLLPEDGLSTDLHKTNDVNKEPAVTQYRDALNHHPPKPNKSKQAVARQKRTRQGQKNATTSVDQRLAKETTMVHAQVEDKDIGPWSTEAFDLFDWRPPDNAGGPEFDGNGANNNRSGRK